MSNFYDDSLDKLASLSEEELLKAICQKQHLIYGKKLKKRLRELSKQMEEKVNKLPKHSYKDILLIFYKCPWLIRLSEFSWLVNKLCEMVARAHRSGLDFDRFWDAIGLVKGQFRTTKASEPEVSFFVYSEVIKEIGKEQRRIEKEQRRKEIEFLTNLYKKYIESNEYSVKLSKQLKVKSEIISNELELLRGIVKQYQNQGGITPGEVFEKHYEEIWKNIYNNIETNRKFWDSIEKKIKKEQTRIKSHAIDNICKKYGVTKRTVQRHLHCANKIWKSADKFIIKK